MDFGEILKVGTSPTGLIGVTLFFVFLALTKSTYKRNNKPLLISFIFLSICSLFGGIWLSYKQIEISTPIPTVDGNTENNPGTNKNTSATDSTSSTNIFSNSTIHAKTVIGQTSGKTIINEGEDYSLPRLSTSNTELQDTDEKRDGSSNSDKTNAPEQ